MPNNLQLTLDTALETIKAAIAVDSFEQNLDFSTMETFAVDGPVGMPAGCRKYSSGSMPTAKTPLI